MKIALVYAALLALALPAAAIAGPLGSDSALFIKVDSKGKHHGKGHGKHAKHRGWDNDRDEERAYREGYREGRRDRRYSGDLRYSGGQYYRPGQVQYGYQRGYHLPQHHRGYVIEDYNEYDLYAPSYGQQWVGVGQNAYLMEAATGLILQVLQDRHR